jgi:peptide/nickel transport system substrate-binding protein
MLTPRSYSRRHVVAFAVILGLLGQLVLMAPLSLAQEPTAYHEAPMLADMVAAGELPPVDERLPSEPMVVEPVDSIGQYGGTIRIGDATSSMPNCARFREHGLFNYNMTVSGTTLDIAKAYNFSADGTTLTIDLREGHKWSDGAPFTVDDILFWWEDVANNPDLSPAGPPSCWVPGGVPATFTKLSDTKLEIKFAQPWPVIMDALSRAAGSSDPNIMLPKHYMQQFHAKYNENAQAEAEAAGYDSWMAWFKAQLPNTSLDPNRPTLWAWIYEKEAPDRFVAVRNPYFHQVDTEGNQLPYIDRVECIRTSNGEVHTLMASTGEFDFAAYYINLSDMPVFLAGEEKGNYKTILGLTGIPAEIGFGLNWTVSDPVLRELFQNFDFRLAISHAIDREAINQAVYFGTAEVSQQPVLPSMPFYDPEWRTKYTEYDPDLSNQLLDGLGLTERDSEGYRLRPDGKRLSILIDMSISAEGAVIQAHEIAAEYLRDVGIEFVLNPIDNSLVNERRLANEVVASDARLQRGTAYERAQCNIYCFYTPRTSPVAIEWAYWLTTNGTEGEEPPPEIMHQWDLWNEWRGTFFGSDEYNRIGRELYGWFVDNLWAFGYVGNVQKPLLVSNDLRNVITEGIFWTSDHNFYGPFDTAQWWLDR